MYTVEEFETLYRENLDRVFGYAIRCVGSRGLAEELTSDAFLALFRVREKIDAGRAAPWLLTVVKNLSVDHWRRQAVEQRHLQQIKEPATLPGSGEAELSVEQMLADPALKPEHRTCLLMRYVHGMERPDIAKATGMTENQVKSCLQYGLVILRKSMRQ